MIHQPNMEQDMVAGLQQMLGKSPGGEFSPEEICLIYSKAFHSSCSCSDTVAAMTKMAGWDSSWTCVGENVLDVLMEMERAREEKELLFWDLQLLNAGNLNHMMDSLTDKHNHSNSTSSSSHPVHINRVQLKNKHTNTRKLKKAARQRWARLASEGVRSLLAPSCQMSHIPNHTWGVVSLSELLLLLEVKYDVITRFLYREMLEEHHNAMEWGRNKDRVEVGEQKDELEEVMEMMEEVAEEALMSMDLLQLAELPGAFRIYRFPGRVNQCWSAVSFLIELHESHQRERHTLTTLSHRLQTHTLGVVALWIWLATLRAQREGHSFTALMSAQQSWETWPNINHPLKADRISLLLFNHKDEEERKSDTLQQQTELQLLVLSQQQEMNQLIRMIQAEADDESGVVRLQSWKQIQKTGNGTLLPQTNPAEKSDGCEEQLESSCASLLISQLTDLQNVQAAALLGALVDQDGRRVQSFKDQYVSEIRSQRFTNLQQLLLSETNNPQTPVQFPHTPSGLPHRVSEEPTGAPRADGNMDGVKAADGVPKKEVCSGCGALIEEPPYLEIQCESHDQRNEATPTERDNVTKNCDDYDKQESLITLAWSKPPGGEARAPPAVQSKAEATDPDVPHREQLDVSPEQLIKEDLLDHWEPSPECDLQTQCDVTERLRRIHPHLLANISKSDPNMEHLCCETSEEAASVSIAASRAESVETSPSEAESELWDLKEINHFQTLDCSLSKMEAFRETSWMEGDPVSALERERTMRTLLDMQRRFEQKQQRVRDRQLLRVQERLSIVQHRKAEEDTDRLMHLTKDLPLEDRNQQKTVVRERLEKVRRERSLIMQSKRERNTAGFKELLNPAVLHRQTEDGLETDTAV